MAEIADDIAALRRAADFLEDPWREDAKWPSRKDCVGLRRLLDRVEGLERVVEAARAWAKITYDAEEDLLHALDALPPSHQDGKPTEGYREANAAFTSGKWYDVEGYALEWKDSIGQECRVTHWMKLPEPPTPPAPEAAAPQKQHSGRD